MDSTSQYVLRSISKDRIIYCIVKNSCFVKHISLLPIINILSATITLFTATFLAHTSYDASQLPQHTPRVPPIIEIIASVLPYCLPDA